MRTAWAPSTVCSTAIEPLRWSSGTDSAARPPDDRDAGPRRVSPGLLDAHVPRDLDDPAHILGAGLADAEVTARAFTAPWPSRGVRSCDPGATRYVRTRVVPRAS